MKTILLLLASIYLAGCQAPITAIRADYATYNQTIQHNQSQQMLLNLVRMKYGETPLFLKVGALTASYAYKIDGGASVGVAGRTKAYGVNASTGYSTRPTISYSPLEGETYVKQVLAEIDPTTFLLLVRSGWPIDTLTYVLVEQIGELVNNISSNSYARFQATVEGLAEAGEQGNISVVQVRERPMLRVRTNRLRLDEKHRGPDLREEFLPLDSFQLRSFLDVMYFLGKNTEVPPEHADMVKTGSGNGWIRITSSANEPPNAMTTVRHRGFWFGIDNTDIPSKDTFALLKLVYQMQAGDIKSQQPTLTLPVGSP